MMGAHIVIASPRSMALVTSKKLKQLGFILQWTLVIKNTDITK